VKNSSTVWTSAAESGPSRYTPGVVRRGVRRPIQNVRVVFAGLIFPPSNRVQHRRTQLGSSTRRFHLSRLRRGPFFVLGHMLGFYKPCGARKLVVARSRPRPARVLSKGRFGPAALNHCHRQLFAWPNAPGTAGSLRCSLVPFASEMCSKAIFGKLKPTGFRSQWRGRRISTASYIHAILLKDAKVGAFFSGATSFIALQKRGLYTKLAKVTVVRFCRRCW